MPSVNFREFSKNTAAFFSRKWRINPLFHFTLAATTGILLEDLFNFRTSALYLIFVTSCISAFILYRKFAIRSGLLILAVACGFAATHSRKLDHIRSFVLSPNLTRGDSIRVSNVEGLIVGEPKIIGTGALNSGRAIIAITQFDLADRQWKANHRFPVFFQNLPGTLSYGDRIVVSGVFEPLEKAIAPGAFDEERFHFRANDAIGKFTIRTADQVRILESNQANPVVLAAIKTRDWLKSALTHGIEDQPVESRSVITAMVLGAREDAPDEIEDLFRLSGTMHIFAVSGLHVGIIAGAAFLVLPWFGFSRKQASLIIIPLILFYAFITGLRPSAIRAAIMVSAVALAFCLRAKPRVINSLGLAALIILSLNTQEVFQVGFQLSFAVLFSIVILAKPIGDWFHKPFALEPLMPRRLFPPHRLWADWFSKKFMDGLGVSIAAWVGSLVLIGWHFKIISFTAVVANIVMIPTAALLINLALISSACFATGPGAFISIFINKINAFLASFLIKLAFFFSSIPGGYMSTPAISGPRPETPGPTGFSMEILSNEGGAAQLFSIPGKDHPADQRTTQKHLLIDSGDPFLFRTKVQPLLRSHGINHLDGVLLSHGDQDHIGAMPIVLDRFQPAMILESSLKNRARVYKDIQTVATLKNIQTIQMTRGGWLNLDPGKNTRWEILFPPADYADQPRADDHSVVIRIHHHDWKILMSFDSGFSTEKWLVDNAANCEADIWVKGWHSSSPSGLTEMIDKINPTAVIATNSGFPAFEKITERREADFASRGIHLFDLSREGCVTISGSREKLRIESFLHPDRILELEQ